MCSYSQRTFLHTQCVECTCCLRHKLAGVSSEILRTRRASWRSAVLIDMVLWYCSCYRTHHRITEYCFIVHCIHLQGDMRSDASAKEWLGFQMLYVFSAQFNIRNPPKQHFTYIIVVNTVRTLMGNRCTEFHTVVLPCPTVHTAVWCFILTCPFVREVHQCACTTG